MTLSRLFLFLIILLFLFIPSYAFEDGFQDHPSDDLTQGTSDNIWTVYVEDPYENSRIEIIQSGETYNNAMFMRIVANGYIPHIEYVYNSYSSSSDYFSFKHISHTSGSTYPPLTFPPEYSVIMYDIDGIIIGDYNLTSRIEAYSNTIYLIELVRSSNLIYMYINGNVQGGSLGSATSQPHFFKIVNYGSWRELTIDSVSTDGFVTEIGTSESPNTWINVNSNNEIDVEWTVKTIDPYADWYDYTYEMRVTWLDAGTIVNTTTLSTSAPFGFVVYNRSTLMPVPNYGAYKFDLLKNSAVVGTDYLSFVPVGSSGTVSWDKVDYVPYQNATITYAVAPFTPTDYYYYIKTYEINTGLVDTNILSANSGTITESLDAWEPGSYYSLLVVVDKDDGTEYTVAFDVFDINDEVGFEGYTYNAETGTVLSTTNINFSQSSAWYNDTSNATAFYELEGLSDSVQITLNASKTNFIHEDFTFTPPIAKLYTTNLYLFPEYTGCSQAVSSLWNYYSNISFNATVMDDYQVHLSSDNFSIPSTVWTKINSSGADLRFTDHNNTVLYDHWIESFVSNTSYSIWVEVPDSGLSSMRMWYNNSNASTTSSKADTWTIYETMDSSPSGTLVSSATYDSVNKYVELTTTTNSIKGGLYYTIPDSTTGFYSTYRTWGGGGTGADAMMFYGLSGSHSNTKTAGDGYNYVLDEWDDDIYLYKNGGVLETVAHATLDDSAWSNNIAILYKNSSNWDYIYWYEGVKRWDSYSSSTPDTTDSKIGWSGYTGGSNNYHRIDDLEVRKYAFPEPILTNISNPIASDVGECYGQVEGMVVDYPLHQGLGDATVNIYNATWSNTTTANSFGYYIFNSSIGIVNGTYTVNATLSGYDNSTEYSITVVKNESTVQNIVLNQAKLLTVTAIDSETGNPILNFTASVNGMTTTVGDGGAEFSLNWGLYTVTVTSTGYYSSSENVLMDQNRSVEISLTKIDSEYYVPHYVKFTVQNIWGTKYNGVDVSVYEGTDTDTTFTGTTGSDGSVTFKLSETTQYRITFINSTAGISETRTLYPVDDHYYIIVSSTLGNWDTYTVPISDAIDFTITKNIINATHSYINVTYTDSETGTTDLKVYLNQTNESDYFNQTNLDTWNAGAVSSGSHSFIVEDYAGQSYIIRLLAEHTTYGTIDSTYSVSFKDDIATKFPGIPPSAFLYSSIFILLFTGGIFVKTNVEKGMLVICVMFFIFYGLGAFNTLPSNVQQSMLAGGILAFILSIIANLNKSNREEGFS